MKEIVDKKTLDKSTQTDTTIQEELAKEDIEYMDPSTAEEAEIADNRHEQMVEKIKQEVLDNFLNKTPTESTVNQSSE